ncbi:Guanine nucleotide-binding protein alpha-3 subunit [Yarrowia sp. B02]|nr:Guanine nucleotide-binding protein alpha-3 subunit [Yarrowia sp. B02]
MGCTSSKEAKPPAPQPKAKPATPATTNQTKASTAPPAAPAAPATPAEAPEKPQSPDEEKEVKTLLLGSGESGKSTIIKQMKIIHQNGYTDAELFLFKSTIYKNILDCGRALLQAVDKFELQDELAQEFGASPDADFDFVEEKVNENERPVMPRGGVEQFQIILDTPNPSDNNTSLAPELVDALDALWKSQVVQGKLLKGYRNQFYLMDSGPYFFHNLQRLGGPQYMPTQDDILRARIKTTGIYETKFRLGSHLIHMYDVGGQRSERKKWIHCFENVTLIIFCVALSEYDQVLLEEKNANRMNESLVLFDSIINSRWFVRTSVVLFLNKIDVFTEKLPLSPLENQFPDYKGGADINKGAKYILWRFNEKNRAGLNIYPHLTQATDTSNIRLVFAAIKETILQNALQDAGILT